MRPSVNRRVFILVRPAGPAGCERRRRVVVVVFGRVDLVAGGEGDDGEGVPLQPARVSVGQFLDAGDGFPRVSGRARGDEKDDVGWIFFVCRGSSPASAILRGPQPSSPRPSGRRASSSCGCCPSREPDGIGGKGAGFSGSSGSTPRQFRRGGQSSKDVCHDLAPTPPRATGGNGARSTFELGGRGGGARERASGNSERRGDGASIEYRSNVDIRVGSGWVQTARGGAASPRPTRRFDVFALLAPSERGTEEETRYGSERGGAHLGVLAQQGQSLIVEIVATSLFLPFRRHYDR